MRSRELPTVEIWKDREGNLFARFPDNIREVEVTVEEPNENDELEKKTVTFFDYDAVDYKTKWSESLKNRILKNPEYFLAKIKKING